MTFEDWHLVEYYGIHSSKKKFIKYRWEIIKSYVGWEDVLGGAILAIGIGGFIFDTNPYINELRAELVGIGIAVLIIDNANEAIKRREEKKRLVLQMGSPDNAFAIEAVRQMRARQWMFDGTLHHADLGRANLNEAILSIADMRGADLGGADLSGALLTGANLKEAILWGADLSGALLGVADLRGADLSGAILSGAKLNGADMSGAKLERATLRCTDLRQAILSGVDLSFANLHQAYLNEVDLTRAILSGTFLEETDLREAKVTSEQLDKAKSLRGAILPDGTLYKDDDLEQI